MSAIGPKASREWIEQAVLAVSDIYPLDDKEKKSLLVDLKKRKESNGSWELKEKIIKRTYKKHLMERVWWHWGEYEYWRQLYFSGVEPTGFKPKRDPYALQIDDDIYTFFSLPALKKVLEPIGVDIPKKNVKKGVAQIVRNDEKVFLHVKRQICLKIKEQEFFHFVYMIDQRAASVESANYARSEGFEVRLMGYDEDEESTFVELARKRNPHVVPPFWPGAPTWWGYERDEPTTIDIDA